MVKRSFVDGSTVLLIPRAKRISNTGHVGIHYIASCNTHQVCIGSRLLGWRVKLDDAVALRAEGQRRIEDGTFDDWFAAIKAGRSKRGFRRK